MRRSRSLKALLFVSLAVLGAGCDALGDGPTEDDPCLIDDSTGGSATGGAAGSSTGPTPDTGGSVFGVGGYWETSDSDRDGIDDDDELALGLNPASGDSDGDGCLDDDEVHFDGCAGNELVAYAANCAAPQFMFTLPEDIVRPTGTLWLLLVPQDPGPIGEGGQGNFLPSERVALEPLGTEPPFDGSLAADSFSVDSGGATIEVEVPESDHFVKHDYSHFASVLVALVDDSDALLASFRLLVKDHGCYID